MNTKKIWASLKQQEGECACPRLQLLFEQGRRTQGFFDYYHACLDSIIEAGDDRSRLCSHAEEIQIAATRMKMIYFEMLVKLIEEEHVMIVLYEAGQNGDVRSRTGTWEELKIAKGPTSLNCGSCGQILMASKRTSTPREKLN